jgi:hypothetical protein
MDSCSFPIWIRGPELRKRWGYMPNSTFYLRLRAGLIPKAEYPFGSATPYWRMEAVLEHERRATAAAAEAA